MRTDIGCCQGAATLSPALMGLAGILNSGTKGLSIFMTITHHKCQRRILLHLKPLLHRYNLCKKLNCLARNDHNSCNVCRLSEYGTYETYGTFIACLDLVKMNREALQEIMIDCLLHLKRAETPRRRCQPRSSV